MEFSRVWLALQVRQLEGVAEAVVVIDSGDGDFVPVARWPGDSPPDQRLADAMESALAEKKHALNAGVALAQPLMADDVLVGAVAFLFKSGGGMSARLRQLRWGSGWLIAGARRVLEAQAAEERERSGVVLDLLGSVLDAEDFDSACLAAVNLLKRRTGSAEVALGFKRGNGLKLSAISDVADFRMNIGHTHLIQNAMLESADQEGSVLYPPRPDQAFAVDVAHAELQREMGAGELLSIPLFDEDKLVGVLQLRKGADDSFSAADALTAEAAAAALGSLLHEKRLLERSLWAFTADLLREQARHMLGAGYLGRKITALVLTFLVVFFSFATGDFRVQARAEVQGRLVRSISAPLDGNIQEQFFRAGDRVQEGQVLARLDDRDMRIELLRIQTDIRRFEGEYDKALSERNATEARIAAASIAESEAREALLSAQVERSEIKAPFEAIVIAGDLSQALGSPVRRGEELFQLAPLESYRVRLEVNENDLDEIAAEQVGDLVLASLPGERFKVRVMQIIPSLEASEGENVAIVEAEVIEGGEQIRPGMQGIAKVYVEDRLLIDIWTRPILDWFRLALWRWLP